LINLYFHVHLPFSLAYKKVLVPVGNEKKMAEAMTELITDKKLYEHYRRMSLERIKYFSDEKMLKAYKKLIIHLMKE
jgi:glycosyltransferase involved in cell wall biosynthesis